MTGGNFDVCPVGSQLRLRVVEALEAGTLLVAYRPLANTVCMVAKGGDRVELGLEVARAFHQELGEALRMAEGRAAPLTAVSAPR